MKPASGARTPRWRVLPLIVLVAGALALLIAVLVLASTKQPEQPNSSPLIGRVAPAAHGTLNPGGDDEQTFSVSRRKGSWVVLNFFSHDCAPCIREHAQLIRFVEQERSRADGGAEFYSVVQRSNAADVEAFFAQRGGDWPVVYDTEFAFQIGFGVARVPETWIIDPSGTIRARFVSEVNAADLSARLRELRGESA